MALITHGPFFSPTYLGNFLTVSNLEAGPVARLYSFWYEQNAFNDRLSVRAGLMSADSQFLQSKTAANFINNGISWPMFLAANLPGGGPAYPLPAPGIRVRIKPRDDVAFQAAVFSGDPSGGNGSNQNLPLPTGTVFSFRGGAFVIAELSYLPNQGKDAAGLPGAYRIGAWYHTSPRFGDQRFDNTGLSLADPMSTGIPLEHTGDTGIYGVVDQMLYRVPGTDDRGLSGFVRAGGVPNDRNLINFYADAGLLYKGLITRRPDDKVGVAAGYARVGDNARGLDCGHRFVRKLLLSGAERRGHGRDDLPGPDRAVVDAATGGPIYLSSGRRRPEQRRKLPTECVGDRAPFRAQLLSRWRRPAPFAGSLSG